MRKRYWVVLAFLALAGLGNLIGGTDTPGRAAVDPASGSGVVRADVPAATHFDATMYVAASSLNLRVAPGTGGRVLTSLPRNTRVLAGERRSGLILVSAQGQVGWISEQYLAGAPVAPAISVPTQSNPGYAVVQRPSAGSCPSRQYCTRIGSCEEARWYLANVVGVGRWMRMEMVCPVRQFVGRAFDSLTDTSQLA